MLDFMITLNDGFQFLSRGWADRPMHELILTIHAMFPGVREIAMIGYRP